MTMACTKVIEVSLRPEAPSKMSLIRSRIKFLADGLLQCPVDVACVCWRALIWRRYCGRILQQRGTELDIFADGLTFCRRIAANVR
jgi:hypothetical protein